MRVISQDGTMDVPFEKFFFYLDADNSIIATRNFEVYPDSLFRGRIAEYSSREKALKAMEMLRTTYLSRMELEGGYDQINGCYVQPNFWVIPNVLQFPKKEEIEK